MQATILDRFPMPPCARTLGFELIEADAAKGTASIRFEALPSFCNPAGQVQGGFLAAMLDDSMGPAVVIASRGERYPVTISLTVTFLAPASPGPITGRAQIRQLGRTIGCVEASLEDADGVELARAVASVRLMPLGIMVEA